MSPTVIYQLLDYHAKPRKKSILDPVFRGHPLEFPYQRILSSSGDRIVIFSQFVIHFGSDRAKHYVKIRTLMA